MPGDGRDGEAALVQVRGGEDVVEILEVDLVGEVGIDVADEAPRRSPARVEPSRRNSPISTATAARICCRW
jgi:hypothetical protein